MKSVIPYRTELIILLIKCILFAGVGKVGGACADLAQSNAKNESCDFKEDPSNAWVYLPEEVG